MGVPAARVVFPAADRAEIAAAVSEILRTGALTLGPYTRQFEAAFATAHGARHAVATASGTAALDIALRVAGTAGREVIVPANTFFATAAAVLAAGATPVFADIDPATFALSPHTVAAALTPDTAAVVLVHIGGLISPQAAALAELCAGRGLTLIEDAAHAHGATCQGRFAGAFGAAAAFSFYPTKVLTSGEGGMLLAGSEPADAEARVYRDQGKAAFGANRHERRGYAWRMSELHAVTGLVHLRRLAGFITRRRDVAAQYTAALTGLAGLAPLAEPAGCRSNFYKYIVLLPPGTDRPRFKHEVAKRYDVHLAGEVYDLPLHQQPVFAGYARGALPATEDIAGRHICLPVHSDMRDDEIDQVLTAVTAVYGDLAGAGALFGTDLRTGPSGPGERSVEVARREPSHGAE